MKGTRNRDFILRVAGADARRVSSTVQIHVNTILAAREMFGNHG
jgi:hypothetical protein